MKKILCYLGVIVLLFLTILPPVLRFALPDKNEEKEDKPIETVLLVCSSDTFLVNTNYENDKVRMIVMKKLKTESTHELENIDEEDNQELETNDSVLELINVFEDFKNKSSVIYNSLADGEVIALDFSIATYEELNLTMFTKSINEQKMYYQQYGLTCMTRK